ncbi:MAG: CcmD family protein [Rhodothermales bacterium]|nr:CcmD family protein [Rhodothermales bacterium]
MPQPAPDTLDAAVYDSVWAGTPAALPEAPPVGLEVVMLQQDKLYVVLAVVLLIWFGLLFFLFRTDRRLARLEREVESRVPERDDELLA